MRGYQKIRKLIIFVMLVLLLTCVLSAFIPHAHECCAADCAICAMLETSRGLLLALLLVSGTEPVLKSDTIPVISTEGLSVYDKTLVALKVKLSD